MKIKTYLIVVLLAVAAMSVNAQRNDVDATNKALTQVIKKWAAYPMIDNVVEDICGKFKKNPEVFAKAAEAFWWNGADSARAFRYADRAITIDPTYAEAYVLKGDIWAHYKDTVNAEAWYNKAISVNPQSVVGYEALANIRAANNPDAAVAMLEKIKDTHPDYPFHVKAARIYYKLVGTTKFDPTYNVLAHYEKAEQDSMEVNDVVAYATTYYGLKNYDKVLEIVNQPYATKFAGDPYLSRLCLFSCVELEQYKDAEEYAKSLFQKADSITSNDYRFYVRAYMGQNKYDAAIGICKKWMEQDIASDADKQYAIGKIAEAYKELGEYGKAEEAYSQYIAGRMQSGNLSAYDINSLARMYMDKANESNGQEKIDAFMKADSVYNIMATKFVQYADMALYQRYRIAITLHPDPKDGAAMSVANNLIAVILAKSEHSETDKARLVEAYRYIAFVYLENKNFKKSKVYWQKVLEIDPTNEGAMKALNVLKKY